MKLRYLDGLRGWAALAVVFDHLAFAFLPYSINKGGVWHHLGEGRFHDSLAYTMVNGEFAVCIFFILSGIVLSASFFRTGRAQSVQASAAKRYFRLAIPAGVSVLAACALVQLGWFNNQTAAQLSGSNWWSHFWVTPANWWQAISHGFGGLFWDGTNDESYNPVLWTLKIELWGSFLVYFVLLAFGQFRRRWLVYAVLTAILWKTYYMGFILGLITADVYFHGWLERLPPFVQRFGWIPLLILGLVLGSMPQGPLTQTIFAAVPSWQGIMPLADWRLVILMTGAYAVLVAVLLGRWPQRFLTWRVSAFLGRISFALYLTHFLVLGSYASYLFTALRNGSVPYAQSLLITGTGSLAIILCVAYLYAKHVDEPAIRLSAWLYQRVLLGLPVNQVAAAHHPGSQSTIESTPATAHNGGHAGAFEPATVPIPPGQL